MKENLAILLLLLITTVLYSIILVRAYDSTRAEESADFSAAFEKEELVRASAIDMLPSPTPSPTPSPAPSPTAVPTQAPTPVPFSGRETEAVSVITPADGKEEATGKPSATTTPTTTPTATPTPTPMDLIVDLDYNSDVDDTAALRIAATLSNMGKVKIHAVMASTGGEDVCKALHAQLSYDGYGSVPIGAAVQDIPGGSPYWDELIGRYFNPADYKVCNSVELYKKVLRELDAVEKEKEKERKRLKEEYKEQKEAYEEAVKRGEEPEELPEFELPPELEETEKLRIVTTGYLVNVAGLISDPEGNKLMSKYVDSVWITGGIYLQGEDHNFVVTQECADAAQLVLKFSPVPLVYSSSASVDAEGVGTIFCGSGIQHLDTAGRDPVAIAFRAYGKANDTPMNGGRYAWDPFCLWAASVLPEESQTHLEPVHLNLGDKGYNTFRYDLPANCRIIRRNSDDLGWYAQQLELLINAGCR
ncbi:MAG: hypothetical protein K6E50_07665 [Lachnospiraceae bacterium]|nr:hypothetical protein [Lachnospiraceae bacterium]